MNSSVELDELVEHWTVLDEERHLLSGKGGAGLLGFALLLKYFVQHGWFPLGRGEFADDVVRFVGAQVKVSASELGLYEWDGRTIERHRSQIREHLGVRECSVHDAEKLGAWLASEVCEVERDHGRVRARALTRCRGEGLEPPSSGRLDRVVRSGPHQAEVALTHRLAGRLSTPATRRLEALVEADQDDAGDDVEDDVSVLALVRSVPGNVSLESMLVEIRELRAVRAVGLPAGLFAVRRGTEGAGRVAGQGIGGVPIASAYASG